MERELDSGLIAGYKDNLCKIYFLDYILYSLSIQQDVVTVDVCVLNSTTVNLSFNFEEDFASSRIWCYAIFEVDYGA